MNSKQHKSDLDAMSNTGKMVFALAVVAASAACYGWIQHPSPTWGGLLLPAVWAMHYATKMMPRKEAKQ